MAKKSLFKKELPKLAALLTFGVLVSGSLFWMQQSDYKMIGFNPDVQLASVTAPTISAPTSGQTGVTVTPRLTTGAYASSGDPHDHTDWKIVADGAACNATAVASNLGTTTDLLSTVVGAFGWTFASGNALTYNTSYELCVQHSSAGEDSGWTTHGFTTESLSGFNSSGDYRFTNNVATVYNDYSFRIDLDVNNISFDDIKNSGADIRVTDSAGQQGYPFFLQDYDGTDDTAILHVKVPQLPSSGTNEFKIYYNNASASSASSGHATFMQFIDENDVAGFSQTNFTNLEAVGSEIWFREGSNSVAGEATFDLNSTVVALDDYLLEYKARHLHARNSGWETFIMGIVDGSAAHRIFGLASPKHNVDTLYAYEVNKSPVEFGTSLFNKEGTYNYEIRVQEENISDDNETVSTYKVYDDDFDHVVTQTQDTINFGSPTDGDKLYINSATEKVERRVDTYMDYAFFRPYLASAPTFVEIVDPPNKPSVISPSGGATDVAANPSITGSSYSGDSSHLSTDSVVSTSNSCTTDIVWTMTDETTDKTSFTVNSSKGIFSGALSGQSALASTTNYYVCVRYTNSGGDSSWSDPVSFTTGSVLSAPSVTSPTSGQTGRFTNLTVTSSGDGSHTSTDAKIMPGNSCTTGTAVWSMTDETTNKTSFKINSYDGAFAGDLDGQHALKYNTTYYACVRYANAFGDSNWSSPLAFTTESLSGLSSSNTVTVNNSGSQLDDYQVRVVLDSDNFVFANAESNGADIRFASDNGANAYPYYIDTWDPSNNNAVMWVKVPVLSASGNTTFKIHYNDNTRTTFPVGMGHSTFMEFLNEDNASSIVSESKNIYLDDWVDNDGATGGYYIGINAYTNGITESTDFDLTDAVSDGDDVYDDLSHWDGGIQFFEDNSADTVSRAVFNFPAAFQAETQYTLETKIYSRNNPDGTDVFAFGFSDSDQGSGDHRISGIVVPYASATQIRRQANNSWAVLTNSWSSDNEFYVDVKVNESGGSGRVRTTMYDANRTSIGTSAQDHWAESISQGNTVNSTDLFFVTDGGDAQASNILFDYIGFREYAVTEPTVTLSTGATISNLSVTEEADGTGNVTISHDINSITASEELQVKVEYSLDGGSTWNDPTLLTSGVTASAGGAPSIVNAQANQVGTAGAYIDASGGTVSVSYKWDAETDTNSDISNMQIRVTPYDNETSTAYSAVASDNTVLDVVAPTAPGSLSASASSGSATISWTASTETNFDHYEIWYGETEANVDGRTGDATEWDNSDDSDLATRTTTDTTITGLSAGTTYYFMICAIDDYGFENCPSSFSSVTGSAPTLSSLSATQPSDRSGIIEVTATVDDVDDDDTLYFTLQDNCAGSFASSVIEVSGTEDTTAEVDALEGDEAVYATYGDPGFSGNTVGVSGAWITTSSGANTVHVDLAASNCSGVEGTYQIRAVLSDGGDAISPVDANVVIDQKDPSTPTGFTADAGTATTMPVKWGPASDKNFNHYEIWYGTDSTDVTNETGTATEFDDTDDGAMLQAQTDSTTLTGLTSGQTYYLKLCALDDNNNKSCTSNISSSTNTMPRAFKATVVPTSSTRANACVTVEDADNPGTFHLGADYSTNSGNTWTKMTVVSGSISATSGTPGLNNGENHQIRSINMSSGSNRVCFDWDTGTDVSDNSDALQVRFRPYDGSAEGVTANGDGGTNESPVAKYSVTCTELVCSFNSSASSDPDGAIDSRSWLFGDGSSSTSSNPSKTFNRADSYMVTLKVTDEEGATDTVTKTITVADSGGASVQIDNEPPVADISVSCDGRTCNFSATSSTDSDGTVDNYLWNAGGAGSYSTGSATSSTATYTFSSDGVYKVKLRTTDNDGDVDVASLKVSVDSTSSTPVGSDVTVNEPPTASFTQSCTNLDCSFNASGSSDGDGSISSYAWMLGDGRVTTGATPSISYSEAGTYVVRLETTDNDGATDVQFRKITVSASGSATEASSAPVASFSKSCTNLACTFNSSGSSDDDDDIATYYWSFGDGGFTSTSGTSQAHTFSTSGTYRVTLVVEDDEGNRDSLFETISVYAKDTGGLTFVVDNDAPSGFGNVAATANTSSSLALGWDAATDSNFNRYECWYGTDATKVANRDITGATRWDESYDPNLLDKDRDATTISQNISEDTTYSVKCWAKDIYGNEITTDAITQKSNDRPDLTGASQTFPTDGTGKLNFATDVNDNDDQNVTLTYSYNSGSGWEDMTLVNEVTADNGSPSVSGNTVTGLPTSVSDNTVTAVWDSKTDLPAFEGTLQIRSLANDGTENGEATSLTSVTVDNLAPRGLADASGVLAWLSRPDVQPRAKRAWGRNFLASLFQNPKVELASTESVALSWTPVDDEANWSGIAAYWVTYGLASDALDQTWDSTDDSDLTTMATSSTTITGLNSGTTYYFKIHAQDQFGNETTLDTITVSTSSSSSSSSSGGVPFSSSTSSSSSNDSDSSSSSVVSGSSSSNLVSVDESKELTEGDRSQALGNNFTVEIKDHWSENYYHTLLLNEDVQRDSRKDSAFAAIVMTMVDRPDAQMNRERALRLLVSLSEIDIDDVDIDALEDNFSDVSTRSDLGALIEYSFEEGLITGYSDGTFRPKKTINRVEALKLIQVFFGLDDEAESHDYDSIPFPDVKDTWYTDYLMYAYDNGIVGGYEDGTFGPNDKVTYSQFLKMALNTRALLN